MLDRDAVIEKMQERGFVVYATLGSSWLQFISKQMYDKNSSQHQDNPIINVIINLEKEEFKCIYNVPHSINTLSTGKCGSVFNDTHFNRIVGTFETQAKWLARLV